MSTKAETPTAISLFFGRDTALPATINASGLQTVNINMSAHFARDPTSLQNALKEHNLLNVAVIQKAQTPVKILRKVPWLRIYPDRQKAKLIEDGFKVGLKVPPNEGEGCLWVDNLKSIDRNKGIVAQKIEAELKAGRIAGPFNSPTFSNFRLSPLDLVPKKERNSYRMIHNLSYLICLIKYL